jgi:hypothetical protein
MKRKAFAITAALFLFLGTVYAGKVEISPKKIESPAPAIEVCVSGFEPGTFVNVMVPFGISEAGYVIPVSYGFMENGCRAVQGFGDIVLPPGRYPVAWFECHFEPGEIPTACVSGRDLTLRVK